MIEISMRDGGVIKRHDMFRKLHTYYSNGLLLMAAMFQVETWSLRFAAAMAAIPLRAAAAKFGSGATGPSVPRN